MRKKVGILGGTFNPVHLGHIQLAKAAYEQLALDKVIFMPNGKTVLKQNLYVLPGWERLKLIELSIRDIPYFTVSDIEVKRSGNTYTYETLEFLQKKHPDTDYFFILGADCLFSIEKWMNPKRIFDACTLVAAVREDMDKEDLEFQASRLTDLFGAKIHLLDFPRTDISSSEIRERIIRKQDVTGMINAEAAEYIFKKKLFVGEMGE